MAELTHLDERGQATMVDVGAKTVTTRTAVAAGEVRMAPATLAAIRDGAAPKGDVLAAARIAGIQAAKRTSELIPLCHMVQLTRVELSIELDGGVALVTATAQAEDRTGVEMEAMVAVSVAALTLYDMLKGIDRSIVFDVWLAEKSGGKTGTWQRHSVPPPPPPGV